MPRDIRADFVFLPERNFLTPTTLSAFVMSLVLVAKDSVPKNQPLLRDKLCNSWQARSLALQNMYSLPNSIPEYEKGVLYQNIAKGYKEIVDSYNIVSQLIGGIEVLDCKAKKTTTKSYQIHFCGNGADGLDFAMIRHFIQQDMSKNYIFWNYPGVAGSQGNSDCVHDLLEGSYQFVKDMFRFLAIREASDVTLYGHSLGGGVAAYVARRWYDEQEIQINVKLIIDRSFSRISAVIPMKICEFLSTHYPRWMPLLTAMIALGVCGAALGLMLAGIIATLGLIMARCVLAIGCNSAWFSCVAQNIYTFFNYLATVLGAAVGLVAILSGLMLGAVIGIFWSIHLLWTKDPCCFPMLYTFHAAAWAACCEMDSVKELRHIKSKLPKAESPLSISTINSQGDTLILPGASLNVGLGFFPPVENEKFQTSISQPKNTTDSNLTMTWYKTADHNGCLLS